MTEEAAFTQLPAIPRVVSTYEEYEELLAQLPPFPNGILTYDWYQRLLPMLAAPLAWDAVQYADTEREKGYRTVGYGYQWCVDRLNEILPGHWSFSFEKLDERQRKVGQRQIDWWDVEMAVTIQVGNWIDGEFKPIDAKTCLGGHGALTRADALKGALTNAFKKTAAMFGVGRQAYEGVLDEDFQSSGLPEEGSGRTDAQQGTSKPVPQQRQQGAPQTGGPEPRQQAQPARPTQPAQGAPHQSHQPPRQSAGSNSRPNGIQHHRPEDIGNGQPVGHSGAGRVQSATSPRTQEPRRAVAPPAASVGHGAAMHDGRPVDPDTGEIEGSSAPKIDLEQWQGQCTYTAVLVEAPRTGQTARGDDYCAVKAVLLENDLEVVLRAFADLAAVLAKYRQGDALEVSGMRWVIHGAPSIRVASVGLARDAA